MFARVYSFVMSMSAVLPASCLLAPCLSPVPPYPPSAKDVLAFTNTPIDVLIIGGGTAGLAIASRLSENPHIRVGVLEAGRLHLNDPIIDIPRFSGMGAGDPDYDWNFMTTNQTHAGDRNIAVVRGKVLGGSSAVNGMAWTTASAQEYDAWTEFASPDWSFTNLLPFLKRAENISAVASPFYPVNDTAEPIEFTGRQGAIHSGHYSFQPEAAVAVAQTLINAGVEVNKHPQDGNAVGLSDSFQTVDHTTGMRSYSAKGYYCAQPSRANLHVLSGAQVTRVVLQRSGAAGHSYTATGAQFVVSGHSTTYTAHARKKIILSAGTVQTPHLLELSGVGNATHLSGLGVNVKIDLPSVGENLQDHIFSFMQYQLVPGQLTYDILRSNATFAQEQLSLYNTTGTGLYANSDSMTVFLPFGSISNGTRRQELLSIFDRESAAPGVSALTKMQLHRQRQYFLQGQVAISELVEWSSGLVDPQLNDSYVTLLGGLMHPTSRGNVHAISNDPLVPPALNPNYFASEFDRQLILDVMRFLSGLSALAPFQDYIAARTSPTSNSSLSDEALLSYVGQTCATAGHLVGTAVMAPRELGGVVDHTLKVYGTDNLYVVDASVIPLHIAAHTQATVYGIAEKTAEMISSALG